MILCDFEIKKLATENKIIIPFFPRLVRKIKRRRVISYGLSSFGYDIRLSSVEFHVFTPFGIEVDPKNFSQENLTSVKLVTTREGQHFRIPPHSYGLGVAMEEIRVPDDIMVICLGKSTYARAGIIVNMTPAEPGWRGHLTLEIANSSHLPARVYAGEGICQLLFFRGHAPTMNYEKRKGKYQDQKENVVLAKL